MNKKKKHATWKCRDGRDISISKMEDIHLCNAIKMVARNCNKPGYLGDMSKDKMFIRLRNEARTRKFQVIIRVYEHNSRTEYVDVIMPSPRTRLDISYFPTDWDSRIE